MPQVLDEEVQAALLAVDRAAEEVARTLGRCAEFVQEGRLDPGVVMAKLGELSAKLMSGGL